MSSNPFRKKALGAIDTARAQSPAKSSLRSNSPLAGDDDEYDAGKPRKPKPVKKVRLLSPPPLSPASPEWPSEPPGPGYSYNYSYASKMLEDRQADPFNGAASTDESDRDSTATPPPPAALKGSVGQTPPPAANPFSKTLQDLESFKKLESQRRSEGEALQAANVARQSLNVDAFRRLLMTGKTSDAEPAPTQQELSARAGSASSSKSPATDSSRMGRAEGDESSNFPDSSDGDDDDDDDDKYDDEGALVSKLNTRQQRSEKEKKAPPPPPSSRHGRSLRDDKDDAELPRLGPPRDVNKPLPPSPIRRSIDDESESPFDRESAGKVPEPGLAELGLNRAPVPQSSSSSSKKSAPAPPPRRGHSRSESKNQAPATPSADEQEEMPSMARSDETFAQTSSDEAPSRSDGARQTGHAPAPPPPRRPYTAPRQTSHASSLGISSSQMPQSPLSSSNYQEESDHDHSSIFNASAASPGYDASGASSTKLASPPPPPPARNPSVRRPLSISSVESISRRVSGEGRPARDSIPPPPPRRQQGSSPSSVEAPRRRSGENASRPRLRGAGALDGSGQTTAGAGQGVDILADLDALQREVDALRGKFR